AGWRSRSSSRTRAACMPRSSPLAPSDSARSTTRCCPLSVYPTMRVARHSRSGTWACPNVETATDQSFGIIHHIKPGVDERVLVFRIREEAQLVVLSEVLDSFRRGHEVVEVEQCDIVTPPADIHPRDLVIRLVYKNGMWLSNMPCVRPKEGPNKENAAGK